ncbi:ATP-binding protein [Floccifex sp.]|uniref:ATP-binding protein n=1 Tax=Floccifex sp. TaxID=2815810 RepID=UPI003EFD8E32
MEKKEYIPRIVDKQLELKLRAFGATHIVGPKWCGKTTTAEQYAKSAIKLQRDPNKEALITTAEINPMALLKGETPRLIDEWQDAPNLWDAVRAYCDENRGRGRFILTGSTSKKVKTSHSGTGRISKLKMYPMSLYESGESNGTVSIMDLFEGKEKLENGCSCDLSIEKLIFGACRGGWPESILFDDKEAQLAIPKDYYHQIYEEDIFKIDDIKRSSTTMQAVIRSYARNISTLAKASNILADVNTINQISDKTLSDYIDVLERLFIVDDLLGWCPSIRSKSAMRSGRKREFVDPSIAVAALGVGPDYLNQDLKTFGFIFECLCIRDLRVYSSSHNGHLSYYHDRYGLEADSVLHLDDGRYALLEYKLGGREIEAGAKHLCEIESLIKKYNEKEKQCPMRLPDLKIVVTGTQFGYRRLDGVFVIPIGCLKD